MWFQHLGIVTVSKKTLCLTSFLGYPICRSRGSTRRSKSSPLGDQAAPSVKIGNLMATRCAIILLIAAARSLFWILEQPQNSLFQFHPLVEKVLSMVPAYRYSMRMGDYGARSQKLTWLYTCQLCFATCNLFVG